MEVELASHDSDEYSSDHSEEARAIPPPRCDCLRETWLMCLALFAIATVLVAIVPFLLWCDEIGDAGCVVFVSTVPKKIIIIQANVTSSE